MPSLPTICHSYFVKSTNDHNLNGSAKKLIARIILSSLVLGFIKVLLIDLIYDGIRDQYANVFTKYYVSIWRDIFSMIAICLAAMYINESVEPILVLLHSNEPFTPLVNNSPQLQVVHINSVNRSVLKVSLCILYFVLTPILIFCGILYYQYDNQVLIFIYPMHLESYMWPGSVGLWYILRTVIFPPLIIMISFLCHILANSKVFHVSGKKLWIFLLWNVVSTIGLYCNRLLDAVTGTNVQKYYLYISFVYTGISTVFSFVLTRIAREIDIIDVTQYQTANINNKNSEISDDYSDLTLNSLDLLPANCVNHRISFEIVTSILTHTYYWINYSYLTVRYEQISWMQFFIVVILFHTATEVFQTGVRVTRWYWKKSAILCQKYRYQWLTWMPCHKFIGDVLFNECKDFHEWKDRFLIDSIIRNIIAFFATIFMIGRTLCIVVDGESHFNAAETWDEFQDHMIKACISIFFNSAICVIVWFNVKYSEPSIFDSIFKMSSKLGGRVFIKVFVFVLNLPTWIW